MEPGQPIPVTCPARSEAVDALPGTKGGSPRVVSDETKLAITNCASLGSARSRAFGTVQHCSLLFVLSSYYRRCSSIILFFTAALHQPVRFSNGCSLSRSRSAAQLNVGKRRASKGGTEQYEGLWRAPESGSPHGMGRARRNPSPCAGGVRFAQPTLWLCDVCIATADFAALDRKRSGKCSRRIRWPDALGDPGALLPLDDADVVLAQAGRHADIQRQPVGTELAGSQFAFQQAAGMYDGSRGVHPLQLIAQDASRPTSRLRARIRSTAAATPGERPKARYHHRGGGYGDVRDLALTTLAPAACVSPLGICRNTSPASGMPRSPPSVRLNCTA